jgi:hypothetical protein
VQPSTTTVVLLLENLDVGALATELQRFPFARLVHTTLPEYSLRRLEAALGQSPATPVAGPRPSPLRLPQTGRQLRSAAATRRRGHPTIGE